MNDFNNDVIDESLIASELKKILQQELPSAVNKEERELYEEIERRIALENEKVKPNTIVFLFYYYLFFSKQLLRNK